MTDIKDFATNLDRLTIDLPNGQRFYDIGWRISGFGVNRDSDSLERSNYSVAIHRLCHQAGCEIDYINLDNDQPTDTVAIARFRHWGVGWFEQLMVHVSSLDVLVQAREMAYDIQENYPVLDEEDHARLEWADEHPDDNKCHNQYGDCSCGRPSITEG